MFMFCGNGKVMYDIGGLNVEVNIYNDLFGKGVCIDIIGDNFCEVDLC